MSKIINPNETIFKIAYEDNRPLIELKANGGIYIKGILLKEDGDVTEGLMAFVNQHRHLIQNQDLKIKELQGDITYLSQALHENRCHPDFEYQTTKVRKGNKTEPPDKDWEVNVSAGQSGTDVSDNYIKFHWRKLKHPYGENSE